MYYTSSFLRNARTLQAAFVGQTEGRSRDQFCGSSPLYCTLLLSSHRSKILSPIRAADREGFGRSNVGCGLPLWGRQSCLRTGSLAGTPAGGRIFHFASSRVVGQPILAAACFQQAIGAKRRPGLWTFLRALRWPHACAPPEVRPGRAQARPLGAKLRPHAPSRSSRVRLRSTPQR